MSRSRRGDVGPRAGRLNIVLVAEDSAGVRVLKTLARTQSVTVLTSGRESGQGTSVASVATSLGLAVLPSELVLDAGFAAWLGNREVDLLLNVNSLFVVHPEVVEAPRVGSFNLHPGPLPEYAGLNTPSWAIYNGESTFGVTLHWMDAGIDTGPIAFSKTFEIEDADSALTLSAKCVRHGAELISMLVAVAEKDGPIPRDDQDLSWRRYFGRAIPREGRISWQLPARQIVNFVRACDFLPFASPWGHPTARVAGRDVGIPKAAMTGVPTSDPPGTVRREPPAIEVAAADEWVSVDRLIVDGQVVAAEAGLSGGETVS